MTTENKARPEECVAFVTRWNHLGNIIQLKVPYDKDQPVSVKVAVDPSLVSVKALVQWLAMYRTSWEPQHTSSGPQHTSSGPQHTSLEPQQQLNSTESSHGISGCFEGSLLHSTVVTIEAHSVQTKPTIVPDVLYALEESCRPLSSSKAMDVAQAMRVGLFDLSQLVSQQLQSSEAKLDEDEKQITSQPANPPESQSQIDSFTTPRDPLESQLQIGNFPTLQDHDYVASLTPFSLDRHFVFGTDTIGEKQNK